jgi:hypothetical protein
MIRRLVLPSATLVTAAVAVSLWIASTGANKNITLSIHKTRAGADQVEIEHSEWGGNVWILRLPEYLIVYKQVDREVRPSGVKGEDGVVTLSGVKTSHGELEYTFVLRPGRDRIDLEATITNTGRRPLDRSASALACLMFSAADDFFDEDATATFVMVGGELTSIAEIGRRHGRPLDFRHSSHAVRASDADWLRSRHSDQPQVPVEAGFIIRSTADGKRHVAQIWDDVFTVAYNFHRDLNCTHANPRFGAVGPGRKRTLHGRVYFFSGSIEELYEVIARDFPGRGLGPVNR